MICFKGGTIKCMICDKAATLVYQPKGYMPSVRLCDECRPEAQKYLRKK